MSGEKWSSIKCGTGKSLPTLLCTFLRTFQVLRMVQPIVHDAMHEYSNLVIGQQKGTKRIDNIVDLTDVENH
jgi:hypothetical protein